MLQISDPVTGGAAVAAPRKRGRPAGPVDHLGRPAPYVIVWDQRPTSRGVEGPEIHREASLEGVVKLMAAWARVECTPPGLGIFRRTRTGWVRVS